MWHLIPWTRITITTIIIFPLLSRRGIWIPKSLLLRDKAINNNNKLSKSKWDREKTNTGCSKISFKIKGTAEKESKNESQ